MSKDVVIRNPVRSPSRKDVDGDIPTAVAIPSVVVGAEHARLVETDRPNTLRVESVLIQQSLRVFPSIPPRPDAPVEDINAVISTFNGVSADSP